MHPHRTQSGPTLEPLEDRVVPYATLLGDAFVVNTFTSGDQEEPAVAMNASGAFVVAFEQVGASGRAIAARRYDAAGVALGDEVAVESVVENDGVSPAVAMDAAGNFVVAWFRFFDHAVVARYFAADGTPAWPEVTVTDITMSPYGDLPSVAMTPTGFVVAWDGNDSALHAKRYDTTGALLGEVNLALGRDVELPRVGADAAGNFVVTYTDEALLFSGGTVYARRFDAAGVALGGEVVVSPDDTNTTPQIAVEPDGDFVVAWVTDRREHLAGELHGVFVRQFAADGTPRGGPIKLDSPLTSDEGSVQVGVDAAGNFVATWSATGGGQGVRGSAAGYTYGSTFPIQGTSLAVSSAADRFVLVGPRLIATPTTDHLDIFGQRYATGANLAPVLDPSGDPTFTFVAQDAPDPHGDTVASVAGSTISDVDLGALQGVAVVGLTGAADGTWQFSTDGGATWAPFGTVSEDAARLLRSFDLVRFVPGAGFLGTAILTYRAWDWTLGAYGETADVTGLGTGGTSAFSAATETATMTVTPTGNHAPVLDTSGSPTLYDVPLNQVTAGNAVAEIVGASITDRNYDALEGIAVVGLTGAADGTWEYSTNGGFSWTPIGTTSAASALLLRDVDRVRFIPNAEFVGSATITYHAWDQTAGMPGGQADLSIIDAVNGPFSAAQDTATLTVTRFHLVGNVLNVYGTPGDDTFSFLPPGTVVLNGEARTYPVGWPAMPYYMDLFRGIVVVFHGRGGTDTANVDMRETAVSHGFYHWGTADVYEDYARIRKAPTNLTNLDTVTYDLTLSDVENVYLSAADGDSVRFHDSAGDDTFVATPTYAYLSTPNSFFVVSGVGGMLGTPALGRPFGSVTAYSEFGGNDAAWFYDSAGNDAFYANAATANVYLSGERFFNAAYGFDVAHAVAGMGGTDTAYYYDSAGNDSYFGGSYQSYLSGFGYFYVADGFDLSLAQALYGGIDLAMILDPARNVASGFRIV